MTLSKKINKKISLTNEIENWRTTFLNILLNKNTIMNAVCDLSSSKAALPVQKYVEEYLIIK